MSVVYDANIFSPPIFYPFVFLNDKLELGPISTAVKPSNKSTELIGVTVEGLPEGPWEQSTLRAALELLRPGAGGTEEAPMPGPASLCPVPADLRNSEGGLLCPGPGVTAHPEVAGGSGLGLECAGQRVAAENEYLVSDDQ